MRTRMDRENRAKQFMPFAALKGYPEALRSVEQVWEPQTELSEESEAWSAFSEQGGLSEPIRQWCCVYLPRQFFCRDF